MLEKSKEKVELKEDLIEKEKKIKKKRSLKKTVLAAMLLPVLGVSLFQSSYMAINDQAKKIVSNAEVNQAEYLLSPKFTENYYYDHLTKKDYSNAQYEQDLQIYDRYKNEIKIIYRNEVSSNNKMLAIFPKLKTESGFVNDLNSNPVASYITFSKFYDMENSTEKGQNRDVSYQGFKKEVIRNALVSYNKGDLSQDQLDFLYDFNNQQENSTNYSIADGVQRLNAMDRSVYSPMSPLGL